MKTECVELNELVSAYADGETSPGDRARVEEHIASCADCRAFIAACRRIDRAAGEELSAPAVEPARWDAMYSQLKAATADRSGKRAWRFKPIRVVAFISSMAAACLLGLAMVMTPREPDPRPRPEISLAGDASDYEVIMVAAPEGGLSMMVIIDDDEAEEGSTDEEDDKGSKPGSRPEDGEK